MRPERRLTLMVKYDRRQFLKRAAQISSLTGFLAACPGSCDKKKQSRPTQVNPPQPVSGSIIYYNHTQGEIKGQSYSGMGGDQKTISVSDAGGTDVDPNRIAVRYANKGDWLGDLAGSSIKAWRRRHSGCPRFVHVGDEGLA